MTIASFSRWNALVIGVILVLLTDVMRCHAIALIESSCYMKLTFPTAGKNDSITIEDVAIIESSMATYFYKLFIANATPDGTEPLYDIPMEKDKTTIVRQPLQFRVEVADSILIGSIATISAQVSFLYEAQTSSVVVGSQQLAETFTLVHLKDDTATNTLQESGFITFTPNPSLVTMTFASNEDDGNSSSIILIDDFRNNGGKTSKEVALIVVTVFLSIVLLIVSSVLLHITGGWNACTNAVSNCLFEEVDDDEDNDAYYNNKVEQQQYQQYINAQPTRTFPLQQSQDQEEEQEANDGPNMDVQEEGEEDTNFMDVESAMTSVLPTSASGLLGVSRNKDAVAVHTMLDDDDDDDDESNIYGDGMTPVSRSNNTEPLGITSMRKLQPSADDSNTKNTKNGGFSSGIMMIQNRLLSRSASKKDKAPLPSERNN